MKFFGKEIQTDKINFIMNCISFVLGIIFFIRMQTKMCEQPPSVNYNSERDSLIMIQSRVQTELKEVKKIQERNNYLIRKHEALLKDQEKRIIVKRKIIYSTINSDWEQVSLKDQNAYINKIMYNLNQKK